MITSNCKILLLSILLILTGCIENKDQAVFNSSIITPPASIPFPNTASTFGTVHINEAVQTEKTITLTFSGGQPATLITGAITGYYSFKGGTYPGTGGTCTESEETGTCTVVVAYWPLAIGTHNETMTLSFYNGFENTSQSFNLSGTTVANITSTPVTTNDHGSILVGLNTTLTYTIANVGTTTMTGITGGGLALADYRYNGGGGYPGTGGTCGVSLASGATCTVVTEFTPATNVTLNDTFNIDYSNGINTQQTTQAVTGLGRNRSSLAISDAATYNFGSHVQTFATNKTFTVTNSGDVSTTSIAATALGAPFTFTGGTYPGTSGTCADPVTVGTCTIQVTFTPTALVTSNDTLTLTYHDGVNAGQTATRPIQGTGITQSALAITAVTSVNYGSRVIGTQTDYSFTVTNSGQATAASITDSTLAAPFTYATGSFPGGGTCTTSIAGGANCTVIVRYSPATSAVENGTITLNYSDELSSKSANLAISGTGQNPASLAISNATSNDFGSVIIGATSVDRTFNLTNSGEVSATTVADGGGLDGTIYKFKGGTYPGTGGTCGVTITVGVNVCTIVVTYTPTVAGAQADSISLTYHNGAAAGQSATHAITGTAQDQATLAISNATSNDFGSVIIGATSVDRTFNLTNSGDVSATTVADGAGLDGTIYKFKGGTYPGTGGTCGVTITVGTNVCTIVVTYTPTVSGAQADSIILTYHNGLAAGQSATHAITGTAQDQATLAISNATSNDFGSVVIGATSVDRTFNLSNSGDVSATSVADGGGLDGTIYQFKGGTYPGTGGDCGTTITTGVNVCTIVVTYTPTVSGVQADTISLTYHNGLAAGQTATHAITGTAQNPAVLAISNVTTNDFGSISVGGGGTSELTFNVTNSGEVSATTVVGSGLDGVIFQFKGGTYPGTGGTCTATITTGVNVCTIILLYDPGSIGVNNDSAILTYNNGAASGQTTSHAVTGTGIALFSLEFVNEKPFNYETHQAGSRITKSFTLTNASERKIKKIKPMELPSPFIFEGGTCKKSLRPGENCTLSVSFEPNRIEFSAAHLMVTYKHARENRSIAVKLTGSGSVDSTSPLIFNLLENEIHKNKLPKEKILYLNSNQELIKNIAVVGEYNHGKIYVLDMKTSNIYYEIFEEIEDSYLGLTLHNVGDYNGDGVDDFISGEYKEVAYNKLHLDKIHTFSGETGELLFQISK